MSQREKLAEAIALCAVVLDEAKGAAKAVALRLPVASDDLLVHALRLQSLYTQLCAVAGVADDKPRIGVAVPSGERCPVCAGCPFCDAPSDLRAVSALDGELETDEVAGDVCPFCGKNCMAATPCAELKLFAARSGVSILGVFGKPS